MIDSFFFRKIGFEIWSDLKWSGFLSKADHREYFLSTFKKKNFQNQFRTTKKRFLVLGVKLCFGG